MIALRPSAGTPGMKGHHAWRSIRIRTVGAPRVTTVITNEVVHRVLADVPQMARSVRAVETGAILPWIAMIAAGVVVLTAVKANRILWTCGAGTVAAIASLAVVSC